MATMFIVAKRSGSATKLQTRQVMAVPESQVTRKSRLRRWIGSLLKVLAGVALVWAAFQVLGLQVVRVSRLPTRLDQATVPLQQGEGTPFASEPQTDPPRNVILFIADGVGFAHLSAARAVLHGINGPAIWDRFTATGWQRTHPIRGLLNDSAGAATAMATGHPTYPGAIAVDSSGEPLETLFERAAELGYRTGIVTDSYIWDATPAAFVTHGTLRNNANAGSVLRQLGESSLEILVGELEDVGEGSVPEWQASVEMISSRFEVLGPEFSVEILRTLEMSQTPTAAVFEEDQVGGLNSKPALPALVSAAVRRLSSKDQPFLLLVESEEPDSASHEGDLERLLRGMEAIEAAVEILLEFAVEDGETLLVFTSDHETGGLALSIVGGKNSELRSIWATTDHTGSVVPVLAFGPGSDAFDGIHANWEIGRLLGRSLQEIPQSTATLPVKTTDP